MYIDRNILEYQYIDRDAQYNNDKNLQYNDRDILGYQCIVLKFTRIL